jgi:hypothetical protein
MLEPVGRHEATERGRFAPSLGVRQGVASIAHSESQRRALLLPDRGDERHQDEAGSDPDQKPGAEVAEQDAKPNADKDPADKCRAAVRVATSGRRRSINRVRHRSSSQVGRGRIPQAAGYSLPAGSRRRRSQAQGPSDRSQPRPQGAQACRDDGPRRLGARRVAGHSGDELVAFERPRRQGGAGRDGGRPGDVVEKRDLAEEVARPDLGPGAPLAETSTSPLAIR